jgi:hypothetical protein
MFGCFVICGKLKAFLKKFWVYKWVASKFDVFFWKIMGCKIFPKILETCTSKFIDSGVFGWIVTKLEVLFGKS